MRLLPATLSENIKEAVSLSPSALPLLVNVARDMALPAGLDLTSPSKALLSPGLQVDR